MLDGGEAEPGRAVAEREQPAHGDDPLGPAQGADVLEVVPQIDPSVPQPVVALSHLRHY